MREEKSRECQIGCRVFDIVGCTSKIVVESICTVVVEWKKEEKKKEQEKNKDKDKESGGAKQ